MNFAKSSLCYNNWHFFTVTTVYYNTSLVDWTLYHSHRLRVLYFYSSSTRLAPEGNFSSWQAAVSMAACENLLMRAITKLYYRGQQSDRHIPWCNIIDDISHDATSSTDYNNYILWYIINITKSISGPNLTSLRQWLRLIFDMGGPMNIFNEYMGGLKIYLRQWLRLIFDIGGTMNIFNEYMGGLKIYLVGDAVKCRSSRLPLWCRMSIVEAAVVMSNVDRRSCRCDVDRRSCRCDVECQSSKLPLWCRMSIVEAAIVMSNVDRRSCRCDVKCRSSKLRWYRMTGLSFLNGAVDTVTLNYVFWKTLINKQRSKISNFKF